MSDPIIPFNVEFDDSLLQDLRRRLEHARYPERETCDDWRQGIPLDYVQELAAYWRDDYDPRRCEALLNRWPQYRTAIDGIDIHFIHRRSPRPDALPMIVTHGWPGSTLEFHKVIDALADPAAHGGDAADAFHLVIPSLPGFGFSGKPTVTGTGADSIGRMWGALMARLGYERYVAQGGDWGAMVTQCMAMSETRHCAGVHVTLPIVAPDPDTMDDLSPQEQSALEAFNYYNEWDSGYSKQQSTRPQTLAYGLADSPVGQLAWIVEKFQAWTDCERDGVKHPEHVLTRDELLDNVMLYWMNNTAASSARLYWESFREPGLDPIGIPVGCTIFPHEIMRTSRRWAERRFSRLIYWNEPERGGHFAALEQPALFIRELRDCFRQLR